VWDALRSTPAVADSSAVTRSYVAPADVIVKAAELMHASLDALDGRVADAAPGADLEELRRFGHKPCVREPGRVAGGRRLTGQRVGEGIRV
jgi:hypothetical protein